ncbi:MAG: hypothetical protein WDA12_00625 [Bacilli bacterium]
MKININDVVTLNDDRKFVVLSETVYDETKYFYLIELTNDGEEVVDNIKIVKELITEDGTKLIVVKDSDEIDDIKEDLVKNLDKNDFE